MFVRVEYLRLRFKINNFISHALYLGLGNNSEISPRPPPNSDTGTHTKPHKLRYFNKLLRVTVYCVNNNNNTKSYYIGTTTVTVVVVVVEIRAER